MHHVWNKNHLLVYWHRVENATGYEYRYRVNSNNFSTFKSTRSLIVSLRYLLPGDVVEFEIRANYGGLLSDTIRRVINIQSEAKPESPRLHHYWTGRQLVVNWNRVESATGYEFRYNVNGKGFSSYQSTRSLRVSLTDLSPGAAVIFDVRARNGGLLSDTVRRVINIPREAKPESPRLHHIWTGRQLVVYWNKVEAASAYEYRYRVNAGAFSSYQSTRSLRVSLTDLSFGDVVRFEVRALNGDFWSDTAQVRLRVRA